jgi:hypothetical protein
MVNKQICDAAFQAHHNELLQRMALQQQALRSPFGGLFGGAQQGLGSGLLAQQALLQQSAFPPGQRFGPFAATPLANAASNPKKENKTVKYLKGIVSDWLADYWLLVAGGSVYMLWTLT